MEKEIEEKLIRIGRVTILWSLTNEQQTLNMVAQDQSKWRKISQVSSPSVKSGNSV